MKNDKGKCYCAECKEFSMIEKATIYWCPFCNNFFYKIIKAIESKL